MPVPRAAGMLIVLALFAGASQASAAPKRPPGPSSQESAATLALFRSDRILMNWALRFFDANGDSELSPAEAAAAAANFRKLADVDRNGRITPTEYRLARRYILKRY